MFGLSACSQRDIRAITLSASGTNGSLERKSHHTHTVPAWWNEQMCLSCRRSSCMHPSRCQRCGSCSSVASPDLGSCTAGGDGWGGPLESMELPPWSPHRTIPRKRWEINTDFNLLFCCRTLWDNGFSEENMCKGCIAFIVFVVERLEREVLTVLCLHVCMFPWSAKLLTFCSHICALVSLSRHFQTFSLKFLFAKGIRSTHNVPEALTEGNAITKVKRCWNTSCNFRWKTQDSLSSLCRVRECESEDLAWKGDNKSCFFYPDWQLNLFCPPQQHPRVVGSHTLEEMSVDGQNFTS